MTLLKLPPTILLFGIAKAFDISIHSLATVGVSSTLTWTRVIDDPHDIQLVLIDQIRAVRKTLIPKVPLTEEGKVAVLFDYPSDFLIQGVSGSNETSTLASTHVKAESSPASTRSPVIAESALVSGAAFSSTPRSSNVHEIHSSIVIDLTTTETLIITIPSPFETSSLKTHSMSVLTSSSTLSPSAATSTTSSLITITSLSASPQSTTTNSLSNGTATSGISSPSPQSQNSHQVTVSIRTALIIGVVSGTLLFIILFLVVIVFIICRRRRRRRRDHGRFRARRRSRTETSSTGPPIMYQTLRYPKSSDLAAAERSRPRNLDQLYQNGGYSGPASYLKPESLEDGTGSSNLNLSASAAPLGSDLSHDRRRKNRRKRKGVVDFRDIWNGSDSVPGERLLSQTPPSTTRMNDVETSHFASMSRSRSDAQPRTDVLQVRLNRYSQMHSVSNSKPESDRPIPESDYRLSIIERTDISPSISSVTYQHPPGPNLKGSASANSPPKPLLYFDASSPNMRSSEFLPLPEYQRHANTQTHTTTTSMTSCWLESEESETNYDKELQRVIDEREAGWAMEGFLEPLSLDGLPPSYGV